ncbi:MAG TPA: PIN domain-containing protein [Blastocatellia bacterium]|nr:PIN domain-containing protein [Blastocatellia bacterium]
MGKARALVDTDVVSFFFNNSHLGLPYRQYMRKRILCISFMTLAEIERGMWLADWKEKKRSELEGFLAAKFATIHTNDAICNKWAEITSIKGRPFAYADAWIAATAIVYKVPLITHNRKHFEGIPGLKVISKGE